MSDLITEAVDELIAETIEIIDEIIKEEIDPLIKFNQQAEKKAFDQAHKEVLKLEEL